MKLSAALTASCVDFTEQRGFNRAFEDGNRLREFEQVFDMSCAAALHSSSRAFATSRKDPIAPSAVRKCALEDEGVIAGLCTETCGGGGWYT